MLTWRIRMSNFTMAVLGGGPSYDEGIKE